MEKEIKVCCVTGHRPENFPWDYYDEDCISQSEYLIALCNTVIKYIKLGYTYFICGGARGVDLDFADYVLGFRDDKPLDICLEVAVPYPKQDAAYSPKEKKRYAAILKDADKVTMVSERYMHGCLHKRNRYMVDKADTVICVWSGKEKGGTYQTLRYAEKKKKNIDFVDLHSFTSEYKKVEALIRRVPRIHSSKKKEK